MIRRAAAILLLAASCAVAGAAASDPTLHHFAAVRAQLDPRAQATLKRIKGLNRQLLATRAYLRAGDTLDQRWSWTQQQIDSYAGSPAQIALDAEIHKVRLAFEKDNPGYSLFVNPQVRSLDLQLQRWNENPSVARAAGHLRSVLDAAVRQPGFPPHGSPLAAARFRDLLTAHTPQPIPTLAAPGLSRHGRMNAVDFQIQRADRIVAGPVSAQVESVWIGQGWREKLLAAVQAASTRFSGPLASPAEPWHYEYLPQTEPQ